MGESLREYVAKFNIVALETLGVDVNIKIYVFIQGLRNGPFFDSLKMNEPMDFRDLFRRITPMCISQLCVVVNVLPSIYDLSC